MSSIARIFKVYIMPGCIFQSVMVGGGYGTGRELVEYFTQYGFWGGLLGLTVSTVAMATILALTFEIARLYRAYDYRTFIRGLLGPFWVVYEVTALVMLLLMLSVLAAACGSIFTDAFLMPRWIGIMAMVVSIGLLAFFGRYILSLALTFWAFVLYAVFIAFLVIVLLHGSDEIAAHAASWVVHDGWFISGLKYGFYNLAIAPLVLYAARPIEKRREAIGAGILAAVISLLPGAIFHVAFFAAYPGVTAQEVPVYWMIQKFYVPGFLIIYSIMLFGTLIETGAGSLQGVFERIDTFLIEKGMKPLPKLANALIAIVTIGVSIGLSGLGVITLVANGYGLMAWAYMAVFIIPILTIGIYKIIRHSRENEVVTC